MTGNTPSSFADIEACAPCCQHILKLI